VRLRYLAIAYNMVAQPKQAFPLIERAQRMAELLADPEEQVRVKAVLAQSYAQTYAYEDAIRLLRECIQSCEEGAINDPPFHFRRLVSLAVALTNQRQTKPALAAYERAIELSDQFSDRTTLAHLYAGMAKAYQDSGDVEAAIVYNQKSVQIYEELGLIDQVACALDNVAALYVEYGLLPALTLLCSLPLKEAAQDAEGRLGTAEIHGETFGLSDLHLGARVPLHRGRWAASVEPDVKIPLRGAPEAGASGPALGTGLADLGAGLAVGAGIPRVRGYAQGSAGYRIRGGRTAEEAYWDFEVGLEPARSLRVRFRYDAADSRGARTGSGAGAPAPSAGEQDFHRVAPTLAVGLGGNNEVSVTWRRVVGGRSTIRSSEWELGFSFLGSVVPARAF